MDLEALGHLLHARGLAEDLDDVRSLVADFAVAGCDELIFFPCSTGLEQVSLLAESLAEVLPDPTTSSS